MMNNSAVTLSNRHIQWIVWSLLLLAPVIGMAVDLISPSLPAIAKGLSVTEHAAKNSIAIYLLGYAIGNFITGFLSDAWGRQKLLRISLILFFIVSIFPVFSHSINVLLLSRLMQGLALGAVAVLYKTIFSDILESEKIVHMGVLIGTMYGIGPVIGPVIGGYLQFYFGWQACFVFFAISGLLLFLLLFFVVPETHFNRHPLNLKTIQKNSKEVLSNKLFLGTVLLMGCAYSLIIVFNTMAPFFVQNTLQYTPVFFGHLALLMGCIFLASTLLCKKLLKKFPVEKLYFIGIHIFLLITLLGFIASLFLKENLILFSLISAAMYFSTGFIFPMSMGKGVSLFRHISGAASAMMYLINILMTSFSSYAASFIHTETITPILGVYLFLLFICFIVYWKFIHCSKKEMI